MLYKFNDDKESLEAIDFYDYSEFNGKEKHLENLLANNLPTLYYEDGQLMPIFQERQWQEEPDLLAIDAQGNLIIFELKLSVAVDYTSNQIMRYTEKYGQFSYEQLNDLYKKYKKNDTLELIKDHKEAFQLDTELEKGEFNKNQKMIIVGNSLNIKLINNVEYWKSKGIDIDFLPYRFYKINDEIYFEFFAKPYDYHINPKDLKGIIFDTNGTFNQHAVIDMLQNSKVSAYGDASKEVEKLRKGDYVLFYQVGYGVVAIGKIKNDNSVEIKSEDDKKTIEKYKEVELIIPKKNIVSKSDLKYISASEIKRLLKHDFYWSRTAKVPYLSLDEVNILIEELEKLYK